MRLSRSVVVGASAAVVAAAVAAFAPSSASLAVSNPQAVTAVPAPYEHAGRILAGNCFQCHGTNGRGGPFDTIAGESATELYRELKELQTSTEAEEAIMRIHALGYTDDQLRLIADYFANVP